MTIRYTDLPARFLRNQEPGFRRWARSCAAAGTLYYAPALGGLRTLAPTDTIPAGWLQVTVTASPVAVARLGSA